MAKTRKSQARKPAAKPANSVAAARKRALESPGDAGAWKNYGGLLTNQGHHEEALEALRHSLELNPDDPYTHSSMAFAHHKRGELEEANHCLDRALSLDSNHVQGLVLAGIICHDTGKREKALAYFEKAELLAPHDTAVLRNKAVTLGSLARIEEALVLLESLLEKNPDSFGLWNDYANLRRDLGRFEGLDAAFLRAIELAGDDPVPYSNRLTYVHYDPAWTREQIYQVCLEWQRRYAPASPPARPRPEDLDPERRIRLGLFSDGFRNHPVGTMIVRALENLSKRDVELFLYPTHSDEDHLTKRLRKVADRWQPARHLKGEDFARQIREDRIDILVDLSGHNSGTRATAVALQPAPLNVKWVGGLINTTGVAAMDYLISDAVETPPGDAEDALFTEKLIRLPDDYIVFSPPPHTPPTAPLPALGNGFITLGCFNNPTKINSVTLREWARLMHELPDSRLLLKGKAYASESYRQGIVDVMAEQGIHEDRLILEGPSSHRVLLETYNRVDIALDPWPYSGGLTTCEALLMGVPVVTLPGPTFAGRHSATHLVNTGMPELVVNSWDEYRARVVELAADLESLATIREHLRDVLLQSPVCDGARFARHLMTALRAVWQRYCEGKPRETLTFDSTGVARFKGSDEPVQVLVHPPEPDPERDGFNWNLQGRVVAVDNSSKLLRNRSLELILRTRAFSVVAFDPRSLVKQPERYTGHDAIQHVPHALLGDGQPGTLFACLDPQMSSTLRPLPAGQLSEPQSQSTQVLAELPIGTIALDSIEGLGRVDWLLLDEYSDAASILEHGRNTLKDTLLIEARIALQATHERQPSLDEMRHWGSRHGFRFHHFARMGHRSHFPVREDLAKRQSSELVNVEAVFIPDPERIRALTDDQRVRLAFLLHTIYGVRDLAHELLAMNDQLVAEHYLRSEKMLRQQRPEQTEEPPATRTSASVTPLSSAGMEKLASSPAEIDLPTAPHMSEGERALFLDSLRKAKRYFEYGSGGSTVWAVREGLEVHGVESDAAWVNSLRKKLGPLCQVEVVDIGPTGDWGMPTTNQHSDKFPGYSRAIDQHMKAFDLILVDGRFRVASTMAALQHLLKYAEDPTKSRIFIHDFWNRPGYHAVLEFLETLEKVDTAGLFRIRSNIDPARVASVWKQYSRQPV